MGFLKGLGSVGGKVTGTVLGAPFKTAGFITRSKTLSEIGKGITDATHNTGKIVGEAASGVTDILIGTATLDGEKVREGAENLGNAGMKTGKGIASGAKNTIINGKDVVDGVVELDGKKVLSASGKLAKTAVIAAVAVTITDEISDGAIDDDDSGNAHAAESDTDTNTEYSADDFDKNGRLLSERELRIREENISNQYIC